MKSAITLLALTLCLQVPSDLAAQQSDSSKAGKYSLSDSRESTDANPESNSELSEANQRIIQLRIEAMMEKDQQFRTYLSLNTTDEKKVAEYEKLSETEQMKTMFQKKKDKLPEEVEKVLWELQRRNDRQNLNELASIIKEFGYPGPHRISMERDRVFALLLHPPVSRDEVEDHTKEWCKLLLREVKAGRMEAESYAKYVDNMRGKILRRPQLYGTNKQFDRATGKIRPGLIEDLEATNRARREIGMPELKEGEYRLWKNDPRSKQATRKIK